MHTLEAMNGSFRFGFPTNFFHLSAFGNESSKILIQAAYKFSIVCYVIKRELNYNNAVICIFCTF
jgi:hypothetical protein